MRRQSNFRWTRPTRQARSLETLQRLLDAGEALIAEKGFDDVPVTEVARRAGLSVGAFYSRFRDKDGFLHCLQDRFVDEARETAETTLAPERWRGASIAEIASELIDFMVRIHRERLGVLREILLRVHGDPEIVARKERLISFICGKLNRLVEERADEVEHQQPAQAADFAFRLVLGLLAEAILVGGPGAYGIPRSDEHLARELTRAFLAYLGVRPAGSTLALDTEYV